MISVALLFLSLQSVNAPTWGPFTFDVAVATEALAVAEVGRVPKSGERFVFARVRVQNIGQHWFCTPFKVRLTFEDGRSVEPLDMFADTSEPRWPKVPSLSVRAAGEAGYLFSVPSSTIKAIVFEQQDDDRKRCETERAWPFDATSPPTLELSIKELPSTQPVSVNSNGTYLAQLASLRVVTIGVRRVQDWDQNGRVVRPRAGFDFVIVDFRVTNTGPLPNCTVFDATLKTDYFGEITREQASSRLGLERLPAGSEVAVHAVFEIARQREPLGVMLSAHSDDACRSGFQPRLPEMPLVRALIPLRR